MLMSPHPLVTKFLYCQQVASCINTVRVVTFGTLLGLENELDRIMVLSKTELLFFIAVLRLAKLQMFSKDTL